MTRLLAATEDADTAAELVAERKAMRVELEAMRLAAAGNVVRIADHSKRS